MTNKEYLQQLHKINDLIESDLEEISKLRHLSTSLQSPGVREGVSGAAASSETTYTRCIQKICDLEGVINREVDRFVDLKSEARAAINLLIDPNEKLVLKLRYLECLSWEKVSKRMRYDGRYVLKLHKRALEHFKIPPQAEKGH